MGDNATLCHANLWTVKITRADIRPMSMKRVRGFIFVTLRDGNGQPRFCVVSCRYVSIHEVEPVTV